MILPIHFHVLKHIGAAMHNDAIKARIRPYYWLLKDHYTDKLFSFITKRPFELRMGRKVYIKQISFEYSRLFCDVERLENDPLEERVLGIHSNFIKLTGANACWYLEKEDAIGLVRR